MDGDEGYLPVDTRRAQRRVPRVPLRRQLTSPLHWLALVLSFAVPLAVYAVWGRGWAALAVVTGVPLWTRAADLLTWKRDDRSLR